MLRVARICALAPLTVRKDGALAVFEDMDEAEAVAEAFGGAGQEAVAGIMAGAAVRGGVAMCTCAC